MPQAIPIILLATAAVGAGETIYSAVNRPSAPKADPNAAIAAKAAQDHAEKAQIAQQAPSIQAQLGGSVSPEYYISQSATETGNAGDTNLSRQALQGFLGLGEPATPGAASPGSAPAGAPPTNSSSKPFEDILNRFYQPGGGGGELGTSGGYA